jgi:hypothetical protein
MSIRSTFCPACRVFLSKRRAVVMLHERRTRQSTQGAKVAHFSPFQQIHTSVREIYFTRINHYLHVYVHFHSHYSLSLSLFTFIISHSTSVTFTLKDPTKTIRNRTHLLNQLNTPQPITKSIYNLLKKESVKCAIHVQPSLHIFV